MNDSDKKLIRNSTAEFLIFTGQAGEQSIEARYEEEIICLSQKLMATPQPSWSGSGQTALTNNHYITPLSLNDFDARR